MLLKDFGANLWMGCHVIKWDEVTCEHKMIGNPRDMITKCAYSNHMVTFGKKILNNFSPFSSIIWKLHLTMQSPRDLGYSSSVWTPPWIWKSSAFRIYESISIINFSRPYTLIPDMHQYQCGILSYTNPPWGTLTHAVSSPVMNTPQSSSSGVPTYDGGSIFY